MRSEKPKYTYQRLTRDEVYQHNILMVAFIVLALTGFMALIPTNTIEVWFGQYGKTIYWFRGVVHRFFAVVLIIVSIWHIIYLIFNKNGRSILKGMLIRKKDLQDFIGFFRYVFVKGEKPQFDRFDYREKLEYITGGIGMVIITVTGIILSFSGYFTKFVVDISATIHLMEANLATMAVSVWHMYAVHIKPGKFPMSTVWIDGKMSLHEYEEEHAVAFEREIKPLLESGETTSNERLDVQRRERAIDSLTRKFLVKAVIVVFILALAGFNVALVKSLFFRRVEKVQAQEIEQLSTFERILQSEADLKHGHFHNLDITIDVEERVPTLCLRCHGNRPHTHSKEVRSLLNMHTYFAACELCHIRVDELPPETQDSFNIDWYDNQTGAIVTNIQPKSGNYGAKLIPSILKEGKLERLDKPVDEQYADDYMKTWIKYTYDQQARAKATIHSDIAQKPIGCKDCHNREAPYLDYVALGYSPNWVEELTGAEVAGMVDKYMTFYIPTMFNPEEIRKEREELMRLRQEIGEMR